MSCPPNGGGTETLWAGHPSLSSLSIRPYPYSDLDPLGRLALRSLGLTGGLASLAGAEAFATTLERLSLDLAPKLASLDGIEVLSRLEVVVIEGLRQITALDWAARLPRLRLLDVFEQKGIESLKPLAGHPSLEFLTFGRVKDLDLEPLGLIPNLKLFLNRHLSLEPGPQRVPVHAQSAARPSGAPGVHLAQTRLTKLAVRRDPKEAPVGTWGSGPFDNDDAGDWTYELTPDADESVVERALAAAAAGGEPSALDLAGGNSGGRGGRRRPGSLQSRVASR